MLHRLARRVSRRARTVVVVVVYSFLKRRLPPGRSTRVVARGPSLGGSRTQVRAPANVAQQITNEVEVLHVDSHPAFCHHPSILFRGFPGPCRRGMSSGYVSHRRAGRSGLCTNTGSAGRGRECPLNNAYAATSTRRVDQDLGCFGKAIQGKHGGRCGQRTYRACRQEEGSRELRAERGGLCKVDFVYRNQCVSAVSSPELTTSGTKYVSAATEEEAIEVALQGCRNAGGTQC